MTTKNNTGLLIIRVIIGLSMLIYGVTKVINGIDFIKALLTNISLPAFFGYGVFLGELIAPFLIIIGYRARIASLFFAFNCLIAILLTQTSDIFKLNQYGGWAIELLAIYMFVAIGIFFTGAGQYALSNKNKWD